MTSEWNPVKDEYGAFTAIYGTLITSFLSLLITIPLGVGTAIFITEDFVPKVFREIIGSFVELLAAIPSVVLGLWAIFVMEPFFRAFFVFYIISLAGFLYLVQNLLAGILCWRY